MPGSNVRERLYVLWLAVIAVTLLLSATLAYNALWDAAFRSAFTGIHGGKIVIDRRDIPGPFDDPELIDTRHSSDALYVVNTGDVLIVYQAALQSPRCRLIWQRLSQTFLCPIDGSQFRADGARISGQGERVLDRARVEAWTHEGSLVHAQDYLSVGGIGNEHIDFLTTDGYRVAVPQSR